MGEAAIFDSESPIILISPIKSGTHLARNIISRVTGLQCYEPPVGGKRISYRDPNALFSSSDTFFSWHLIPEQPVVERLIAMDAKVICLYRNLYDLVVSIYFHFFMDIDNDRGRGAGKNEFLSRFSKEDGLWLILTGFDEEVTWIGLSETIQQMRLMLELSDHLPVMHTTYERLVLQAPEEIRKLCRYLGKELSDTEINEVCHSVSFKEMKKSAEDKGEGTSHFRKGKVGLNRQELLPAQRIALRGLMRSEEPSLSALLEKKNRSKVGFHPWEGETVGFLAGSPPRDAGKKRSKVVSSPLGAAKDA